jgi:nitrogen fixation-related uncharacterized protein
MQEIIAVSVVLVIVAFCTGYYWAAVRGQHRDK